MKVIIGAVDIQYISGPAASSSEKDLAQSVQMRSIAMIELESSEPHIFRCFHVFTEVIDENRLHR